MCKRAPRSGKATQACDGPQVQAVLLLPLRMLCGAWQSTGPDSWFVTNGSPSKLYLPAHAMPPYRRMKAQAERGGGSPFSSPPQSVGYHPV